MPAWAQPLQPGYQLWLTDIWMLTNGSSAPVVALSEARPAWATPPTTPKVPPMYRRLPTRCKSLTTPFIEAGVKPAVSEPLLRLTRATLLRATPLMVAKVPPMSTVFAAAPASMAATAPLTLGTKLTSTAPVVASNAAR